MVIGSTQPGYKKGADLFKIASVKKAVKSKTRIGCDGRGRNFNLYI